MRPLLILIITLLPLTANSQGLLPEQITKQVDNSVTEAVEQTLNESVNENVESSITETVESGVSQSVEQSVEESISQNGADTVSDTVASTVTEKVSQSVGETVSAVVQENVPTGVAGSIQEVLQEALQDTTAETVTTATGNAIVNSQNVPVLSATSNSATPLVEITVDNQWRAVAQEWLFLIDTKALDKARQGKLQQADIKVLDTLVLDELGMTLVQLRANAQLDSYEQIKTLLPSAQSVDRNHIYEFEPQAGANQKATESFSHLDPVCQDEVRIGVVDTAVNRDHPALRAASITQAQFGRSPMVESTDHGTSVAGLLVAQGDLKGVVPNAKLAVAAVMFDRQDGSQGATALSLVLALNWLLNQQVSVINLSLAGPPNRILQTALARVNKKGVTIVAAVGNAGPAAGTLYPAGYPQVIGATAVDAQGYIYRWANRGEQVDFAAVGVAVKTASGKTGMTISSGTSMAAPVVSAFAACLQTPGQDGGEQLVIDRMAALTAKAIDLGEPGRDNIYGRGLLSTPKAAK